MALKLLDIQYLRAQNTYAGQVLITNSSSGVETTTNLVVVNGKVGIGTSIPTSPLTVNGNISLITNGTYVVFPDGSTQNTSAVNYQPNPGGTSGSVQYNNNGVFSGNSNFYWDTVDNRLGIGTNIPKATLQIKDVGYESTNHSTSSTDPIVLDSFPVVDYRSCHYIIQITDENYSWFHTSQIMLIHDGLNAFKSEYNIVTTVNKLGEFDCQVNGPDIQLIFTPLYTSDKNIKVIRTSIEP
jgi:hypothetical protein